MPLKINPVEGSLDLVVNPGGAGVATTSFITDSGTATPTAAGAITVTGGTDLDTSGSGNTVTINITSPISVSNGGTGLTTIPNGAIMVGDDANQVETIGPLTDGQLLIGDTAGVSPVAASLTAGTGITVTPGAGSIQIDATATTPLSFPTDSGTATPAANTLTIAGGTGGIDTVGSGSTVTINLDITEEPSIPTSFATDSGTATPASNILTIAGGTGGIDTTGAGSTVTINFDATEEPTLPTSFPTDSGTATPAANALTIAGGTGIDTSGSGSTVTVTLETPVTVANGGTGQSSYTNGQLLIGNTTGNTLDKATLTGTANEIDVTNGAGSITLTLSDTIDIGDHSSLEIPNSATPTVNADGEIAIDTTVTDWSHGIFKYYGGEEMGVVAMPIAQFTSPTDTYVPSYNATNDEFALVDPSTFGGGGAWVWLNSQTASNSATIEWDSTYITGTYNHYHVTIRNMIPANDNVYFEMLFSNDNASTWEVTNYNARLNLLDARTSTTEIMISNTSGTDGLGNAADEGRYQAEIDIYQPNDSGSFTTMQCLFGYISANSASMYHGLTVASYSVAETINGFQFALTSGNIASGEFILYGIKES